MEYEQIFSNTGYDSGDVPYTKMDICNCPENRGSGGILVDEATEIRIHNKYPFYDIPIYVNGILSNSGTAYLKTDDQIITIKLAIPEGKGYIATRPFTVEADGAFEIDDSIFITNTPTECSFRAKDAAGGQGGYSVGFHFYVLNPENYVNLNYTQKNTNLDIYKEDPYFVFDTNDPSGNIIMPKGRMDVSSSVYLQSYWYGTYVEFPYDYYYLTSLKINDVEQITEPVHERFRTTFDFQEDSTIETETTYMPEERNYYILDIGDNDTGQVANFQVNDQDFEGGQLQGDTANPETFKITFKERDDRKFVSLLVANYETVEVEEVKLTPDENGVYTYNLLLDSDKRIQFKTQSAHTLNFYVHVFDQGDHNEAIDEISVSCDGGEPITLKYDEETGEIESTFYWDTFTINSITLKPDSGFKYDYSQYIDEEWEQIRINSLPFTYEGRIMEDIVIKLSPVE